MKTIILDQPERVGAWVSERTDGRWLPGQGFAFGLEQEGRLIAGVLFDSWNGASLCMHVAAEPGARWLTRDFIRVCFYYPFVQLKAKKVLGLVGSKNYDAQRFDTHLGFVLEATLDGAHPDGALLIYSMTPENCRWLKLLKDT